MGHFSKYIRPGAVRISSTATSEALEVTACKNPDGSTAVVVMNRTDKKINFNLKANGKLAPTSSPAHSIMTLVY
jgi:glucosylceramidase